jgi:hypothetical protein
MKKILLWTLKIILAIFLAFILILATGFFAVRFGLTNVAGEEDADSFKYNQTAKKIEVITAINNNGAGLPIINSIYGPNETNNRCKLAVAGSYNDYIASIILKAYLDSHSEALLDKMLLAMELRLPDPQIFEAELSICEKSAGNPPTLEELTSSFVSPKDKNLYTWQDGEPWKIIKEAIIKDRSIINDVSLKTDIQPRLLVSVAIVEQIRLYYTQRELFEKVFKPLKILANANKMAWGVMSIKEKTAIQTEDYLKDEKSPFYPGDKYKNLLDFPSGADKDKERYNRLTDEHNHYYSYLYGALIIKEVQAQWEKAGYSMKYRPEIIATLFNTGFNNSKPKENPIVGGSTIDIDGAKYFFGSLAYEFYYSGELVNEFAFQ